MVRSNVNTPEAFEKVSELIKDIQVAMLTTEDENGRLHSRPMALQNTTFDGTLWFFTRAHSAKSHDIGSTHQVNVSFANPTYQKYVSLTGSAIVTRDKAKAKALWTPLLLAWFPKGLEDPELALVRVDVEEAEYWDSPSSTVVQLVGFMKAIATGETANLGEHGRLDLHTHRNADVAP